MYSVIEPDLTAMASVVLDPVTSVSAAQAQPFSPTDSLAMAAAIDPSSVASRKNAQTLDFGRTDLFFRARPIKYKTSLFLLVFLPLSNLV